MGASSEQQTGDKKPAEELSDCETRGVDNGAGSGEEQSSDQSADRPKESSLETVRAAGEPTTRRPKDLEVGESRQVEEAAESVRSERSRRSTSRHRRHGRRDRHSHGHHHEGRERSSSRAGGELEAEGPNASDLVEEEERKLRRRRLRLLAAVEDAFEQMQRVDETGK